MALNDVEHCEACQIHEDVVKAVTDHMPDEDQLYDLAEVFKVFRFYQDQDPLCAV